MRNKFVFYAEKCEREQKDAFEKMAQNGRRFSLSIDERTLTKNKMPVHVRKFAYE